MVRYFVPQPRLPSAWAAPGCVTRLAVVYLEGCDTSVEARVIVETGEVSRERLATVAACAVRGPTPPPPGQDPELLEWLGTGGGALRLMAALEPGAPLELADAAALANPCLPPHFIPISDGQRARPDPAAPRRAPQ